MGVKGSRWLLDGIHDYQIRVALATYFLYIKLLYIVIYFENTVELNNIFDFSASYQYMRMKSKHCIKQSKWKYHSKRMMN